MALFSGILARSLRTLHFLAYRQYQRQNGGAGEPWVKCLTSESLIPEQATVGRELKKISHRGSCHQMFRQGNSGVLIPIQNCKTQKQSTCSLAPCGLYKRKTHNFTKSFGATSGPVLGHQEGPGPASGAGENQALTPEQMACTEVCKKLFQMETAMTTTIEIRTKNEL